jgi:hypothetical protein
MATGKTTRFRWYRAKISPLHGTADEEKEVIRKYAQAAMGAVVEGIEIVCNHAGLEYGGGRPASTNNPSTTLKYNSVIEPPNAGFRCT